MRRRRRTKRRRCTRSRSIRRRRTRRMEIRGGGVQEGWRYKEEGEMRWRYKEEWRWCTRRRMEEAYEQDDGGGRGEGGRQR